MARYLLHASYHHNNPMADWYWNLQADSEAEILLKGYKVLVQTLVHDDAIIPDLTPILTQEELAITVYENEDCDPECAYDIVLWNRKDPYNNNEPNRGAGYGTDSSQTSKSDNIWLNVNKRKDTKEDLANAIRGYRIYLEKLPKAKLQEMVAVFDNMNLEE